MNDDAVYTVFQDAVNKYLALAEIAESYEERVGFLEHVQFLIQDWAVWCSKNNVPYKSISPVLLSSSYVSKPELETPIVNHRREAILAQRARRTAS